jgi:hypothetical protein
MLRSCFQRRKFLTKIPLSIKHKTKATVVLFSGSQEVHTHTSGKIKKQQSFTALSLALQCSLCFSLISFCASDCQCWSSTTLSTWDSVINSGMRATLLIKCSQMMWTGITTGQELTKNTFYSNSPLEFTSATAHRGSDWARFGICGQIQRPQYAMSTPRWASEALCWRYLRVS